MSWLLSSALAIAAIEIFFGSTRIRFRKARTGVFWVDTEIPTLHPKPPTIGLFWPIGVPRIRIQLGLPHKENYERPVGASSCCNFRLANTPFNACPFAFPQESFDVREADTAKFAHIQLWRRVESA